MKSGSKDLEFNKNKAISTKWIKNLIPVLVMTGIGILLRSHPDELRSQFGGQTPDEVRQETINEYQLGRDEIINGKRKAKINVVSLKVTDSQRLRTEICLDQWPETNRCSGVSFRAKFHSTNGGELKSKYMFSIDDLLTKKNYIVFRNKNKCAHIPFDWYIEYHGYPGIKKKQDIILSELRVLDNISEVEIEIDAFCVSGAESEYRFEYQAYFKSSMIRK